MCTVSFHAYQFWVLLKNHSPIMYEILLCPIYWWGTQSAASIGNLTIATHLESSEGQIWILAAWALEWVLWTLIHCCLSLKIPQSSYVIKYKALYYNKLGQNPYPKPNLKPNTNLHSWYKCFLFKQICQQLLKILFLNP